MLICHFQHPMPTTNTREKRHSCNLCYVYLPLQPALLSLFIFSILIALLIPSFHNLGKIDLLLLFHLPLSILFIWAYQSTFVRYLQYLPQVCSYGDLPDTFLSSHPKYLGYRLIQVGVEELEWFSITRKKLHIKKGK